MGFFDLKKDLLCELIAPFSNFNPNETILLFSDPRGGSTWLTEALLTIPKSAAIWEPLHLTYNPQVKKIGFSWRQEIPINSSWPEAKILFDKVQSGKYLNRYLAFLHKPSDYIRCRQLIVKFCRGNALLPWLVEQYDFKFKPVYLVRHPYAVISSQLKQGGWHSSFTEFKIPEGRFNESYLKHREFLKTIQSKEEALLVTWCITNQVALLAPNKDKWIKVHYETLHLNPEETIHHIFNDWGMTIPEGIQKKLQEESRTTVSGVERESKIAQLRKWEKSFSVEKLDRFMEILNYFKVSEYGCGILPIS